MHSDPRPVHRVLGLGNQYRPRSDFSCGLSYLETSQKVKIHSNFRITIAKSKGAPIIRFFTEFIYPTGPEMTQYGV